MKKLTSFIILCLIVSSAFAKVWNVSATDSIKTVQAAIDTAASGDTVMVRAAFQNVGPIEIVGKKIALLSRGYMNNPLTYNIASGAALYDSLNNQYLVKISSADSTVIKGFLFDKSNVGNGGGILIENSNNIQIEGVHFKANYLLVDNTSLSMSKVELYGSDTASYDLVTCNNSVLNMDRIVIKNSVVDNLLVTSANSELYANNLAVFGNTCTGELYQMGSSVAYFDYITSYGNTTPGEDWRFASTWTSIRNSILENAPPLDIAHCEVNYSAVPGDYPGTGNLSLDPMISTTAAYPALSEISPCISAADPDTNGIPRIDILGNKRPNPEWAPPDMGAYESARHMMLNNDHHFWISTQGDDVWGNGSEDHPFASVQTAVDYALDTDTLILLPGTYVTNALIENKSLVLTSQYIYEKNSAYKDSVFLIPDSSSTKSILIVRDVDSLKIMGLTFNNGNGRQFYIGYSYGGAIYCENSFLSLEWVDLASNHADYCGGAIYALESNLNLTEVSLNNNSSYLGGAIALSSSTLAYLNNVTINGNNASSGGGIYIENSSKLVVYYSKITNNIASDNVITTGIAKYSTISQYGGAIYGFSSNVRIHNSLISGNHAYNEGAGIALRYGQLYLIQSTVTDNTSDLDYSGVMYLSDPEDDVIILNSILWNQDEIELTLEKVSLVADHSLIFGGTNSMIIDDYSTTDLRDLLVSDPQLDNDNNLTSTSPCLNAGITSYIDGNKYLINYSASEYEGASPDLGYNGASPEVHFILENVGSALDGIPETFNILRAYPNPFNPSTTLEFTLAESGNTKLSIYDINGRHMTDLCDKMMLSGNYKSTFNAYSFPSGIYIARLIQGGQLISNAKLLLVK